MNKKLKSKPILVLASNSFSGSSFIRHLLSLGQSVIGISRSPEVANVFRPYGELADAENFQFLQIDLNTDPDAIATLVHKHKIEIIVNFAAQSMVAQSWENPKDWYQTNVVTLANLCKPLINEKSIKKFIHFTTPEVYGSTAGWLSETFEFAPSTPYAVSRAAGDWHLKCLFENYEFPVVFTRAANVYGPGQQLYRIIPRTILSALVGQKLPLHGGGKSIRAFIHMEDVSSALELITLSGTIGETYHISTNQMISIYDLVQNLADLLDVNIEDLIEIGPERPGKDFAYQLSSKKLRSELGWDDRINLNQGLSETLVWAKQYLDDLRSLPINYEHKR